MNPICMCGYAYASWDFFKKRITFEEHGLINMFGEKYLQYRKSTQIGIPFIN